jgi:hypothetical protein
MSKAETGGAAFPRPASEDTAMGTLPDGNRVCDAQDGMTKREYFAAAALQGIIANGEAGTYDNAVKYGNSVRASARIAVEMADALIAELKK